MNPASPRSLLASRRRVVITGGAGFIGSHLAGRLVADGADVLVIDDLSSGSLDNLPAGIAFEQADIASSDLAAQFAEWRPDAVFHLAAQASVPRSIQDPLRDLAVNVVGTHHVVSAAQNAQARLVFVSSGGAVYGDTVVPATEDAPPKPTSYYGVHKLAAEGHVRLSGIPHAIVRPSNVYGPGQVAGLEGAVVASFLDAAQTRQTLSIHGDGLQTRDFIHVDDVVEALCRLGESFSASGTWNVASGRSVTILQLADVVEQAVDWPLTREMLPTRTGDVRSSALSAARMEGLGWRPAVELPDGVRRLISMRGERGSAGPPPGRFPSHGAPLDAHSDSRS